MIQFSITPQGERALQTGVLPSLGLDEGLLAFIDANQPVTFGDFQEAFLKTPLNVIAGQLLTMRQMGLITQEEV